MGGGDSWGGDARGARAVEVRVEVDMPAVVDSASQP